MAAEFEIADAASLVVLFGAMALQNDESFIYEVGVRHGTCRPASRLHLVVSPLCQDMRLYDVICELTICRRPNADRRDTASG